MFIERLLNQGPAPVLEQMANFAETRHRLLVEDAANVDTPGYRQKDLSLEKFQQVLATKIQQSQTAPPGTVAFDDVQAAVENPRCDILFHDGNNRSMEQLMSDEAKNALMHNFVVELLRQQFQTMETALRERVS